MAAAEAGVAAAEAAVEEAEAVAEAVAVVGVAEAEVAAVEVKSMLHRLRLSCPRRHHRRRPCRQQKPTLLQSPRLTTYS